MALATVIITGISVLAGIGFNYFLWVASKESADAARKSAISADKSAQVAEETLYFSKQQQERLDREREIMSKEYQARYRKEAKYLFDTLRGISDGRPNILAIQKGYNITQPTPYELSQYFNDEQREALPKIWECFLDHYSKFWIDNTTGDVTLSMYEKNVGPVRAMAANTSNEIRELINKL